ncbi:restriction endonuclease [Natronolimnobius sp. AArcel1]|uniref:restriction endonuclease n=1 Tax=Natronolimnobius sp. AArcel1 TaxID=1679093 RepID=UPI0013EB68B0|nr:restriction endonuclease [Natronolimnobius sp. AArcel1]NGM70645.1 restriction endonuclease [Natronolimnobius sp. AArcel1]
MDTGVTKSTILHYLQQIDGHEFEHFIADLWSRRGWDTNVTSQSGDKGIDVVATKTFPYPKKTLIQTKRYRDSNSVSGPELQKYASLKQRENVDEVVIITTSGFTDQAEDIADDFNIKLISGETLQRLVREMAAEDLVATYADGAEIPDQPYTETISDFEPARPPTIVAECDLFRASLVGYEWVTSSDPAVETPAEFDGPFFAFELTNLVDHDLRLHPWEDFTVYDDRGQKYTQGMRFSKNRYFPGDWQVKQPRIPAGGTAKFAFYVGGVSGSVSRIRFQNNTHLLLEEYDRESDGLSRADLLQKVSWMMYLSAEEKEALPGLPSELAAAVN